MKGSERARGSRTRSISGSGIRPRVQRGPSLLAEKNAIGAAGELQVSGATVDRCIAANVARLRYTAIGCGQRNLRRYRCPSIGRFPRTWPGGAFRAPGRHRVSRVRTCRAALNPFLDNTVAARGQRPALYRPRRSAVGARVHELDSYPLETVSVGLAPMGHFRAPGIRYRRDFRQLEFALARTSAGAGSDTAPTQPVELPSASTAAAAAGADPAARARYGPVRSGSSAWLDVPAAAEMAAIPYREAVAVYRQQLGRRLAGGAGGRGRAGGLSATDVDGGSGQGRVGVR